MNEMYFKSTSVIVFSLSFIFLILALINIWPFTIDDMYITLRYARNWSYGEGLLWNINEPPVEGYSNFLFVLLGKFLLNFKVNVVVFFKFLGILGLFLTLLGQFLLSRRLVPANIALLPLLWTMLYSGEVIWSVSGLETTFYQALLIFCVYYLAKALENTSKQNINFCINVFCGFLASLARPEAPILVGIFYLIAVYYHAEYRHNILKALVLFGLLYIPYFLWRIIYFHELFPNPIYCKGNAFGYFGVLDKQYLALSWAFILLSLFAKKDKYFYWLLFPSILYLILLINSDSVSAFLNRLFLPAFVMLLPLAFSGLNNIINKISSNIFLSFALKLCSVLFIALLFIPKFTLNQYKTFAQNPVKGENLRLEVVNWLNANIKPDSRIVLADCGLIPYATEHNYIDSYCLNNKKMSHIKDKDRYLKFCDEIMSTKPEVIILTSFFKKQQKIYTPADKCLLEKLKNSDIYQLQEKFVSNDHNSQYEYEVFRLQ